LIFLPVILKILGKLDVAPSGDNRKNLVKQSQTKTDALVTL